MKTMYFFSTLALLMPSVDQLTETKTNQAYQGIYQVQSSTYQGIYTVQIVDTYLQLSSEQLAVTLQPTEEKGCFEFLEKPTERICFIRTTDQFTGFNWQVSEQQIVLGQRLNTQLVEAIAELLKTHYIETERVDDIIATIKQSDAENPYQTETDFNQLAARLTADLRAVNNDFHLYAKNKNAAQAGPRKQRRRVVRQNAGSGNVSAATQMDHLLANSEYPVDVLPGNVGYLAVSLFGSGAANLSRISHAMQLLKNTDALIIDLRKTPGGSADAVVKLSSYLFKDNTHLVNSKRTKTEPVMERWTDVDLAEYHYDQPVYVLTSNRTGSAAESFLYGLKNNQRVTQVGAATGGGGYNNQFFDLNSELAVSISIGVTSNPKTGKGWQSTGIAPDVEVDHETALVKTLSLISQSSGS